MSFKTKGKLNAPLRTRDAPGTQQAPTDGQRVALSEDLGQK